MIIVCNFENKYYLNSYIFFYKYFIKLYFDVQLKAMQDIVLCKQFLLIFTSLELIELLNYFNILYNTQ